VQSVYLTNVILDGNNTARAGLVIPRLKAGARLIRDVAMVGGAIEDLVGDGVEIDEPMAQLTLTGVAVRHVHGWAVHVPEASWASVSNALLDDVGSHDGGVINVLGARTASVMGLALSDIKGKCLVFDKARRTQEVLRASLNLPPSCGNSD
jgi:hypothetical protein